MKQFYLIFLLCPLLFNAQILDQFPRGQNFYEGGITKVYNDIHQIIVDQKLEKCTDPKELYRLNLLLTREGDIKFVKDFDTLSIAKNQCAYDLSKTLAINLKGKKWIPAEVKGQKFSSIIYLLIYPDDLFGNYKIGYVPSNYSSPAIYKDGEEKLRTKFHDTFQSLFADYNLSGRFYLDFYINADGEIVSPSLKPDVMNQVFKNEVFRTLKRLNHKWNPATFRGIPVKSKISVPITFSMEFYEG